MVIGSWTGKTGSYLAPRELEGVLHCANDLTIKEAARAMRISPETLKKRLDSARLKLGAGTIRALILKSLRMGLIGYYVAQPPAPQHQNSDENSCDGVFVA